MFKKIVIPAVSHMDKQTIYDSILISFCHMLFGSAVLTLVRGSSANDLTSVVFPTPKSPTTTHFSLYIGRAPLGLSLCSSNVSVIFLIAFGQYSQKQTCIVEYSTYMHFCIVLQKRSSYSDLIRTVTDTLSIIHLYCRYSRPRLDNSYCGEDQTMQTKGVYIHLQLPQLDLYL